MKMMYFIIFTLGYVISALGIFAFLGTEIKPTEVIPPVTVSESNLFVQPRGCGFCVDAGCNQTIYLPGNVVKLRGEAVTDLGIVVMWIWTQISGPTGCVIKDPVSKETLVKGLIAGSYVFNFRATTQYEVTKSANVIIKVEPFPE